MRIPRDLVADGDWALARTPEKKARISGGGVPPPVFCTRVRKLLTGKDLSEHSFLKSAEGLEYRGVIFSRLLRKNERVKRERELNAETQSTERSAQENILGDSGGRSGLGTGCCGRNIGNGSRSSTKCK